MSNDREVVILLNTRPEALFPELEHGVRIGGINIDSGDPDTTEMQLFYYVGLRIADLMMELQEAYDRGDLQEEIAYHLKTLGDKLIAMTPAQHASKNGQLMRWWVDTLIAGITGPPEAPLVLPPD